MLLTDSHCHIDFDNFSGSLDPLLKQCFRAGIHRMIIPAVSPSNWNRVLQLQNAKPSHSHDETCQLFSCLGIHPWFLNDLDEKDLNHLSEKVSNNHKSIVAIGETGIDQVIAQSQNNLQKQITFFERHLSLANQYNLPVIVHHRRSHDKIIPLLKKHKISAGGVIHAFSGSYQQAKAYVDLGFSLGIGGTITYERAKKTIEAIKALPIESLLLETDAPSMPLSGYQGEDNSPLQLINVLECLATIRPESIETLAQKIESNTQTLFFDRRPIPLTAKTI